MQHTGTAVGIMYLLMVTSKRGSRGNETELQLVTEEI